MSNDPNRDFAEQVRRTMESLIQESNDLDFALRRGRIGDLIRKYNPRTVTEQQNDNTDEDSGGTSPGESVSDEGAS